MVQNWWCQNWPFDKVPSQFHVPHIPVIFSPKICCNIIFQSISRNSQPILYQNSLLFPCIPESNSPLPLRVHYASSTVYHHCTAFFLSVLIPALENTSCIRFSFWDIFVYNRRPSSKTIENDKTITIYNPTEVQITVNKQIFTAKRLATIPIITPYQPLSTIYIFTLLYLYHLTPYRSKKFPTWTGLSRTIVLYT